MQEYIGAVREFFISLDAIQLVICIELAMIFFFRGLRNKKTLKINVGWGLIYLCFSYIVAFNIWRIYYAVSETAVTTLSKVNFLLPLLSSLILMEYLLQRYQKTCHIFSILGITLSFLYILIPEVAGDVFTNITLVTLLIFGILFFGKFIKLSKGVVRKYILLFTFSFFLVIIGWMLISPRNTELLLALGMDPLVHGSLARGVQIGSFILMAAVLLKLPIFFEVNWRENLIRLYIVVRDRGVPIFHTRFQENDLEGSGDEMVEDLVAGGMAGITAMLKEISQSTEELKTIDHGDLKILLAHGDNFFIALLAKEEMNIYWDRLRRLHRTIESLFGTILKAWDGNLAYFEPLKTIVNEDFQ